MAFGLWQPLIPIRISAEIRPLRAARFIVAERLLSHLAIAKTWEAAHGSDVFKVK